MEDTYLKEHSSTLREYFFQLYKDQSLCDVSFVTKNGTTILAHKLVVAAFSGAVRAEVDRWKDLPQVSILVDCEDNVLKGILEFVYTGSVTTDDELIPSLLDACHGLQIPTLRLYLTEKASKGKKTKHIYNPDHSRETNLDNDVPKIINEIENGKEVPETSGRRARKSKKISFDDEILLSDENDADIVDDNSDDDETWHPSEKRTETASTKSFNNSEKLKHAYVKLERIDVNKVLTVKTRSATPKCNVDNTVRHDVGKHRKDWYTKENLIKLSKLKRKHGFKKKRYALKTSKHFIKNSSSLSRKKNLSVMTAGKIIQICKKFSYLEVNKNGFSCKICKYWNKFYSVVTLHINSEHRNKTKPQETEKTKTVSKVKRMSQKMKKIKRIREKIQNFECFKCKKKYKQMRGLATHLTEKHKFSAERAQKLTGYPKYFSHQKKINSECDLCGEKFDNLNDFRAHSRGVHKKKRLDPDIPCTFDDCRKKFHTTKAMKEHLEKIHKYKDAKQLSFRKVGNIHAYRKFKCRFLQKQTKILKNLAVEEQEESRHETSRRKGGNEEPGNLNKCSEKKKGKREKRASEQKSTTHRKNSFGYKIFLPSKQFRCKKCRKPTVCCHKSLHTKHKEVDHMKILVSKQFKSKILVSKAVHFIKPIVNIGVYGNNGLKRGDQINNAIVNIGSYGNNAAATEYQIKNEKVSEEKQLYESEVLSQLEEYYSNGLEKISVDKSHSLAHSSDVEKISVDKSHSLAHSSDVEKISVDKSLSLALSSDVKVISHEKHCFSSDLSQISRLSPNSQLSQISQNSKTREDNRYNCWKCVKSFHYYSLLLKHVRSRHVKFHLRQTTIFGKIQRHVNMRNKVFSRRSSVQIQTINSKLFPGKTVCNICDKSFSHERYLASHLQTKHFYSLEEARSSSGYGVHPVTNPKSIKCIDCFDSFSSIRGLASHLQSKHKYTFEQAREATGYPSRQGAFLPPKPTDCKLCSETFPSRKKFREHQLSAHGVSCQYCKKVFGSLFVLKRHGMKLHVNKFDEFKSMKVPKFDADGNEQGSVPEKVYNCEKCDFSIKKLQELTAHIIDFHPEVQYPCSVCGFSFRNTESRDKHIVKHHGDAAKKKSVCLWCKKKFLRPCFLRVHAFKIHGIPHPSLKEYKCEYEGCRNISYTLNDRRVHMHNTHQAVKKFPCQHCEYVSPSRHRLLRHVRSMHLKLKPHLCENCGKSFSEEHHMKEHIRRYHTNNYFQLQCEYCAYQCGVRSQLHSHMWHQHKIKMDDDFRVYYQCDICAYQTPVKRKFTNHMNGHNNIRNYACEQCGKTFITASTLSSHKKWKHSQGTDDKVCDQCGYKTKTAQKLNEHIRIQHQLKGIKPYRCPYCDFTCASGGNCRKHIMGKHKGEVVRYECDKEFLEVAKMARKEGNTNPLIVQVENITSLEPITGQVEIAEIIDPNYQQLEPAESANFNQHFQVI